MFLKNSNVLITGGTGSFGNKLTEILLKKYRPKRIVIYSRDEFKQSEMAKKFNDIKIMRYFIGDIRDKSRLERALKGVDYVFHAAALKQVPSCEYNPIEAIHTNVLGTENVINTSIDCGVFKVVSLATDKCVNPVNLYGATKHCAEKLVVASNAYSGKNGTKLCSVRYGNVINSRGSIIPLFKQQKKTGTLYLTCDEMTRFFIRLEDAIEFSISSMEMSYGGEIFVPKIDSCSIFDLAQIIGESTAIVPIGIRPGEKIHEVLVSKDEARNTIELKDRYVILPDKYPNWDYVGLRGKLVEKGFEYTSNNNKNFLSKDKLRGLINVL